MNPALVDIRDTWPLPRKQVGRWTKLLQQVDGRS
jgi:hypothetical protein